MIAAQVAIAVLGVSAVWLSQDPAVSRQRWAPVCGLAAQPFWAWETISAGQYPITALCLLYGLSWWRGFRRHWLASPR